MTTETFIDLAQSELSISGAASENASPVRRPDGLVLWRARTFAPCRTWTCNPSSTLAGCRIGFGRTRRLFCTDGTRARLRSWRYGNACHTPRWARWVRRWTKRWPPGLDSIPCLV